MKQIKTLILYFHIIVLCCLNVSAFAVESEAELLVSSYTNDRHYNQVCWLTSHNSFAYKRGSFLNSRLFPNQQKNIQEQLLYGVRSFMVDLHYENDDTNKPIILAHNNDLTGRKNYVQKFSYPFLYTIKEWLKDPIHQDDIITIHLESYIRDYDKIKGEIDTAELGKYLFDLCEYNGGEALEGKARCILPDAEELDLNKLSWPTLGEMRERKKTIVIFSDKTEDVGKGILHASNTMETKYDLSDYPYCEMRLDGRSSNAPIFIMNHFYGWQAVPFGIGRYYRLKDPNEFRKIVARAGECALQGGQWPNFIAFDNIGYKHNDDREIVIKINAFNKDCYGGIGEDRTEDKIKSKYEDLMHDEL